MRLDSGVGPGESPGFKQVDPSGFVWPRYAADEDFDVAVHLLDGDETAYWEIVRAEADPPGLQTGGVTLQNIPEAPGEYVAAARLVGVPEADPVTYDLATAARERDSSCARIRLSIDESDDGPAVSFRTSEAAEFWSCDPSAT